MCYGKEVFIMLLKPIKANAFYKNWMHLMFEKGKHSNSIGWKFLMVIITRRIVLLRGVIGDFKPSTNVHSLELKFMYMNSLQLHNLC